MLLAGDIGGTKTVLAIFEKSGDNLDMVRDGTFPSREHVSFDEIVEKFLSEGPKPALSAGCFGVAGTVINGRCQTTNLPWQLDEAALARLIEVPRVKLFNDLEAAAFGMLYLRPDERCILNPNVSPQGPGNVAVIAAGTGLGEAMLYWDGEHYHTIPSEGGHADFAPRTEREIEFWNYLHAKTGGHVSYERVLSGPGFHNIYTFLRDRAHFPEPLSLAEELKEGEPNAIISRHGLAGDDPLCLATVEMFCSIYGAEAGNHALRCVATGGVFLGGGIAPKLLPALQRREFLESFTAKGRLAPFLHQVEVSVALNPRAPLLGAAHFAIRL